MKKHLFVLLVFTLFSCTNQSIKEIPYTIIKGKITHRPLSKTAKKRLKGMPEILLKRKKIGLVSNAIRNGLDVPNHNTIVDDQGNYYFKIKTEQATELRLKYSFTVNLPLFVQPGDEVIVDIDFTLPDSLSQKPYKISGDNAAFNQKIAQYDELFRDSFSVELNATLPYVIPREFKQQRTKITQRIRRFQKEFEKKHAAENPVLLKWAKLHSEYRIAMDYMKYAFKTYQFRAYSPSLKEGFPKDYFDFWEEFPVNNPDAITSLNYQNYLQFYRKYLMANLSETTPYQDCKNFPGCNVFKMELEQLSDKLEGKTKELIIAQQVEYHLIRNNKHFLNKGFELYLTAISDTILIAELKERKDYLYKERAYKFPENATLFQSNATGEQIQTEIATKHKRPTILYFWNTQREIVSSYFRQGNIEEVWKTLDSLNFDLVLLAHHSSENIWKDKIVEMGLIQDHWHLNDEQFTYFEDFFQNKRKIHRHYDRIYDRENFMLVIDENGNLSTLSTTSFLESSFFRLTYLHRVLKRHASNLEKNQIRKAN